MTAEQHTIDIPGLPEGWRAVAYRVPVIGVDHILTSSGVVLAGFYPQEPWLILEKIKPRRIVLEETEKTKLPDLPGGHVIFGNKIWRVVEDNEPSFRDRVLADLARNRVIVEEE